MPGPLVGFGTDIDTDALYRRIVQLERFSQDPLNVNIGGGTAKGVKMRIADSRLRQHLYNSGYLQPAPAWVTATAYVVGQAVTSNGNTYMCVTGGTSAAAPIVTTPAPITDGTVVWYYFGPAPSTSPVAPTLSTSVSAPGAMTASKASDAAQTWYDVLGGSFVFAAQGPTWNTGEPANTGGLGIEFMTDSSDFCVYFSFGASVVRVAVDGVFASPSAVNCPGGNVIRITFPTGARKARRITLYWAGSNSFSQVIYAPTDRFWKVPTPVGSFKLFVVGDSYFGGSNYHPSASDRLPHHMLAEMLGARTYQTDAVGGSGYVANGSGVNFANATRLARMPSGQDVIVVAGGINDANVPSLQTAVQSYLSALRAAQPAALICVLGPWAGTLGPDAATNSKESYISAAVSALNDANTVFVPVNSDATGSWLYGTGKTSVTNGSGNTDVYISPDGTHPVCLGAEYLMNRIADAIRAQIRPALT